jgi:S1-C subfamily serine protease
MTAPTGYAPFWKTAYYKLRKQGYEDSQVIFMEKGAWYEDRYVYTELVPISVDSPPEPAKAPARETSHTIGTGFVVREDGLILTAHHLVSDAASITLHFTDGRSLEAKIVKASQNIDLAVLKVNENTPNYLELAKVGSAQAGDQVFTLGYPAVSILGTEPKFTDGAISAKSGLGGEAIFLQVSVPVQPGNSGGPLVNEKGEVVGIITSGAAIRPFFEETGTLPQNVNWAVNADFAQPLYRQPTRTKVRPTKRSDIIDQVRKAICLIQVAKYP